MRGLKVFSDLSPLHRQIPFLPDLPSNHRKYSHQRLGPIAKQPNPIIVERNCSEQMGEIG